eukprot:CAMPEP_0113907980 /NCGR_PEP_ID=MMETSP0780_2-20120614/25850_1 /TAXON_ID=652834 /ORGANISM="Palpitomonas bilix" /LENGTH=88 /DNA_ID=CAMNT_0000903243 /DNA_START=35 /DNA_END=297 /DNA_ORIENTATION=- /assembly_acc=CAM_ASM_000599
MALDWNVSDPSVGQGLRREFKSKWRRMNSAGVFEPFYPGWKRKIKQLAIVPILVLFMLLILMVALCFQFIEVSIFDIYLKSVLKADTS